ncbi:MAG: hypothetical protein MUO31_12980 [Thermodesulfovibrionales bacterium]|nr:hypothetical protein [Thermodesulfovibrionales bacterium]
MPTQGVAPLSGMQNQAISMGQQFIDSPESADINYASQTYRDIAAPGDILDRPEVRGITAKATEEGNLMLNRLGRGMVTQGNFGSNTGRDVLGRGVTAIQERIAGALSEYLNAAENRRMGAAGGLERTGAAKETSKLKKIGTAVDLGSLTRSISQQIEDAQYGKAMNDINFRFNTQPQILSSIMGNSVGSVEGGEPSMFAQASPLIGSLLTAAINAGGNKGTTTGDVMNAQANPYYYEN